MRRTLAVAVTAGVLAVGGLLLGGCSRTSTPPAPAPAATVDSSASSSSESSSDDVGSLLDQVDKQLHDDDQPAADQD